ncbi:MAG TPA: hypothetical protein VM032_00130 [Vicinamibacterales bacterium]|nr:hypothetical protein [Vicinamibacterales bacterium]
MHRGWLRLTVLLVLTLAGSACAPTVRRNQTSPSPLVSDEVGALIRETFEHFHPERSGEVLVFPPPPGPPLKRPSWYGDTIYVLDQIQVNRASFRLRPEVLPRERAKFQLVSTKWLRRRADWRYRPVRYISFEEAFISSDKAFISFIAQNTVFPSDQEVVYGFCVDAAVFVRGEGREWRFLEVDRGTCS